MAKASLTGLCPHCSPELFHHDFSIFLLRLPVRISAPKYSPLFQNSPKNQLFRNLIPKKRFTPHPKTKKNVKKSGKIPDLHLCALIQISHPTHLSLRFCAYFAHFRCFIVFVFYYPNRQLA